MSFAEVFRSRATGSCSRAETQMSQASKARISVAVGNFRSKVGCRPASERPLAVSGIILTAYCWQGDTIVILLVGGDKRPGYTPRARYKVAPKVPLAGLEP